MHQDKWLVSCHEQANTTPSLPGSIVSGPVAPNSSVPFALANLVHVAPTRGLTVLTASMRPIIAFGLAATLGDKKTALSPSDLLSSFAGGIGRGGAKIEVQVQEAGRLGASCGSLLGPLWGFQIYTYTGRDGGAEKKKAGHGDIFIRLERTP